MKDLDEKLVRESHLQIFERFFNAMLREGIGETEKMGSKSFLWRLSLKHDSVGFRYDRIHSLGQGDLRSFPWRGEDREDRFTDFAQFAQFLLDSLEGAQRESWELFLEECKESRQNLFWSLVAHKECWREVRLPWDRSQAEGYQDAEQRVFYGHPLHPGCRLRKEMSYKEQKQWAPEWRTTFPLEVVAVRRELLKTKGYEERLKEHYAPLLKQLQEEMGEGYLPIFCHPWQVKNRLFQLYPKETAEGSIRKTKLEWWAKPTMSLRSFAPLREGDHIKTAVGIQTTGAVRTVSAMACHNGPILTGLVESLEEEKFLDKLTILKEYGSAHFDSDDPVLQKNLSCILRENPLNYLKKGCHAMPAALLLEPGNRGLSMLEELLRSFELSSSEGVLKFMRRYCEVLLPDFLRLICQRGWSLEAHLQNVVLIFSGPWLTKTLYRDFGGIRLMPSRLPASYHSSLDQFHPDSATIIENDEDLMNKLGYPLFQNHLGELIRKIVCHYALSESQLWSIVEEVTHRVLKEIDADQQMFNFFMTEPWRLKCMTKMRLEEKVTEYSFSTLENPLLRGSHAKV